MATKKVAKKAPTKKRAAKKTAGKPPKKTVHKWSAKVDTDSTHPDEGLFKQDADTIAKALYGKEVSPKGPASGMRMLNFYINRAGKNLPEERVQTLEHAKELLSGMIAKDKERGAEKPARKAVGKKSVAN